MSFDKASSFVGGSGAVAKICSVFVITVVLAQAQRPRSWSPAQESLKRFLQTLDDDKTAQFVAAFSDLNGDRKPEAIVRLISNGWCGSGGCNTIVLTQFGDSWKILTSIAITRPSIRVLDRTSHGWRGLGVWVRGGGIQPGYEAELRFDGSTYPSNPSVAPARPLVGRVMS